MSGPHERVYIGVVCEVCGTRMHATEDQVGQTVTCPDCFTKAVVRRPPAEEARREGPRPPVEIDEDDYRLAPGVDQPPPGSPAYRRYIAVVCPVCATRMLATEDQVGRPITCPDCTVPTTVPPPSAVPQKRPPVVVVGENEYRVHEGVDQPPPGAVYVAVVCRLCGTRMYAAEDQVGREITCPDCETRTVVPPPPPDAPRYDPMAGPGEEPRLGEPISPPEVRVGVDYRAERGARHFLPSDRARWSLAEPRDPPPRRAMLSGVFQFPLYRSSLFCWLLLSAALLVVLPLAASAMALAAIESQATWVGGMLITGTGFTLTVMWIAVASAYLLAIVRDTANGHDAVVNWPEAMFLDWLADSYFVFSSLALGLLPGLALRHALEAAGVAGWPCVPVSVLLAFPVLLVSMLETNSPLRPFSLPVLGSLFTAWRAWGLFYVQSTAVLAAAGLVATGLTAAAGLVGLLLSVPVPVAALMIYCRLLGRVVWCASGVGAGEEEVMADR